MASREWVSEHRELQYLRAAARAGHRRTRLKRDERTRRRRYADLRWRKLLELQGGEPK
jgi:hypothetical protein